MEIITRVNKHSEKILILWFKRIMLNQKEKAKKFRHLEVQYIFYSKVLCIIVQINVF